ncbi:MAG: hypothetical protein HY369_01720 [Candidatus Aenigmarchaeota archaeon]|nr:hypothetical protein [Candidatus Aenigmarchaeota archaeon]
MAEAFEEHVRKGDIKALVITMIMSALGFLVALQWRDAIQLTIERVVPQGEGLAYTYVASAVVTVVAVVVALVLIRVQKVDIIPEDRIRERIRKRRQQDQPPVQQA